jgi:O-antigen ligase/tetratricopeptide (TPR) repeat protein
LVWVALFGCTAALGGVALWAIAGLAVVALTALLLVLWQARRDDRGIAWPLGMTAIAAMTVAVALQCVPLPPSLLRALSPATDDLLQFTLGPHGLYPRWRPLSLDPPATILELIKHLSYAALFLTTAQLSRERSSRRRLMVGVATLGLVLAVVAALHETFGLSSLFGIPSLERSGPVSPFVNRNHLASVLSLGACTQLGLAFRAEDRREPFLWGGAFLPTAATALLAGSRGGAIGFLAGLGVLAVLLALRGQGSVRKRSTQLALGSSLVLGALGIAAYLNLDFLMERWGSMFGEKVFHEALAQIWPSVIPMVKEHWLTGVGRGAFIVAFPHYQSAVPEMTFSNPENVLLQLTSEFGVLLGIAFLVVLARAWVEAVRRVDLSAAEAGLLAGLFAVGLHEFADFGLEITGVAVPTLMALAVAEVRPESRSQVRWTFAWPVAGGAVAAPLLLLVLPVSLERDRSSTQAEVGHVPVEKLAEDVKGRLARHPADYLLHLQASVAESVVKPPQPAATLFWANRAMYLAPQLPWPHRLAATALFQMGARSQARLEERSAFPMLKGDVGFQQELLRLLLSPDDFAEACPQTADGFATMSDLLYFNGRDPDSIEVAQLGLQRLNLEEPSLLGRVARSESRLGRHDLALTFAVRAQHADPTRPELVGQTATELIALGRTSEAEAELREGLAHSPGDVGLSVLLARLLSPQRAPEAHALLAAANCSSPKVKADVVEVDGDLWAREQAPAKALSAFRTAAQLVPTDPQRKFTLARVLIQYNRLREAVTAIDEGLVLLPAALRPPQEKWRDEIKAQLAAQDREMLKSALDPNLPASP